MPPSEASPWILILAYIWSSLGLGTSVIAIWFTWLFPSFARKPEVVSRPLPAARTPTIRPLPLENNKSPSLELTNHHVSSEVLLPHPIPISHPCISQESIPRPSSDTSSTSTTSSYDSPLASPNSPDSSCERFSTPRLMTRRLPTLMKAFSSKRKSSSSSVCESETECNSTAQQRKSAGGFSPLWSKSRFRSSVGPSDDDHIKSPKSLFARRGSPAPPPNCSPKSLSGKSWPHYFMRKSETSRRQSVPVPPRRTEPYGAPYFALPPTVLVEERLRVRCGSESRQSRDQPRPGLEPVMGRRPITKRRSASTSRAMTSMQL